MSDPDRLTSHDKTFDRDTRGLILRIIVLRSHCALLAYGRRCGESVTIKGSNLDWRTCAGQSIAPTRIDIRKTILEYTEKDLDRVVTLNLKGTFYFFQAFGRLMIEQGAGSIIACSSVRAVTIDPGLAVYGSTKAAIGLLVKGFASEVGRFGVRVNAIAPSIVETALTDIHQLYAAHTVFSRWSNADEVARAVTFLASYAASYESGSTLFVDGVWTAIDGPRQA
jgi:NAD(P)-dependent dehydrogenase (short-subunit alcohol dehydrogenase family)